MRRAFASSFLAIAAVVLAFALPWLIPSGARACSCVMPPPPEQALAEADAVFEARPFSMSNDDMRARYSFEVDRVWKGEVPSRVEISTALHSATCGRTYQIGTKYIVYARRSANGELTDHLCTRTRTASSAAEDLQILGAGEPPRDGITPPPTEGSAEPTEPPRIEPAPVEPPPHPPGRRGCAVEKPHAWSSPLALGLFGLAVAVGRRRTVRSTARRSTGVHPTPRAPGAP